MDIVLAIATSAIGSAGLFGLIQFLISRHDKRDNDIKFIKDSIGQINSKCDRNELATTRLQLIFLVQTQPDNKDTILQTAQRYFIELDGNGEAWVVFDSWAKDKKIDLAWYKMLLERKEKYDNSN